MSERTVQSIVFPVSDLANSKAVFKALIGADPHTDSEWYVGWNVGGIEIGLNPSGPQYGQTTQVAYWGVTDIAAAIDELVAAGATVSQEPNEPGGGVTVATVTDAGGNLLGLIQSGA